MLNALQMYGLQEQLQALKIQTPAVYFGVTGNENVYHQDGVVLTVQELIKTETGTTFCKGCSKKHECPCLVELSALPAEPEFETEEEAETFETARREVIGFAMEECVQGLWDDRTEKETFPEQLRELLDIANATDDKVGTTNVTPKTVWDRQNNLSAQDKKIVELLDKCHLIQLPSDKTMGKWLIRFGYTDLTKIQIVKGKDNVYINIVKKKVGVNKWINTRGYINGWVVKHPETLHTPDDIYLVKSEGKETFIVTFFLKADNEAEYYYSLCFNAPMMRNYIEDHKWFSVSGALNGKRSRYAHGSIEGLGTRY